MAEHIGFSVPHPFLHDEGSTLDYQVQEVQGVFVVAFDGQRRGSLRCLADAVEMMLQEVCQDQVHLLRSVQDEAVAYLLSHPFVEGQDNIAIVDARSLACSMELAIELLHGKASPSAQAEMQAFAHDLDVKTGRVKP
jgi:hypothetical protein